MYGGGLQKVCDKEDGESKISKNREILCGWANQLFFLMLKKMEVFNVKIKTNCSGEDKIYASGEQRETQENLDKDKEDELMK